MTKVEEPQFAILLLCCFTLTASVYLCVYAFRKLNAWKTEKKRSKLRVNRTPRRRMRPKRSACVERLTSLPWLAKAIVVSNLLTQLYIFGYYVVQTTVFRGFNEHSPMLVICRVNRFLFHQPFVWLLCELFWFQRLILSFNESGFAAHSVSASTQRCFYGALVLQFVYFELIAVYTFTFANVISPLKSTDLSPYQLVNDNMVTCTLRDYRQKNLVLLGYPMIAGLLSLNGFLAFSYVRKLQCIFEKANRRNGKNERGLVRKSVTVAIVTTVSSCLIFSFAALFEFWAAFALDALVNTLCVVLYFGFASDRYQFLCGRIETCVMWIFSNETEAAEEISSTAQTSTVVIGEPYIAPKA